MMGAAFGRKFGGDGVMFLRGQGCGVIGQWLSGARLQISTSEKKEVRNNSFNGRVCNYPIKSFTQVSRNELVFNQWHHVPLSRYMSPTAVSRSQKNAS